MAVQLKPHQQKVLPKLSSGKVLYGGVGSGKSITTAAYYMEKEAPKDVYVITTAKVRNDGSWEREFAKFGVGTSRDATVAGVLKVDSWNNINKYKDVKNAFFIFDEQKVVGSGAWVKAFIFIAKRNNWLLLTATPGDTWIDYIPIFVANGFYRNRTEFKDIHVEYVPHVKFPKVRRYHNVGKLVRLRNSVLVHMPFERHTVRKSKEIQVDFDEESFHRALVQRWHVYEERPLRNVAELFLVLRRIVNSDNSRLDAVKCLMQKHPKLIIFYNFDFELEALRGIFKEEAWLSQQTRSHTGSTTAQNTVDKVSLSLDGTSNVLKVAEARTPEKSSSHHGDQEGPTNISFEEECSTHYQDSSKPLNYESTNQHTISFQQEPLTKSVSEETKCLNQSHQSSNGETNSGRSQTNRRSSTSRISSSKNTTSTHSMTSGKSSGSRHSSSEKTSPRTKNSLSDSTDSGTFAVAEWNGHKHEPIPTTDRWVYLVNYKAGAEGWNCVETDAMVFFSLTYSYKEWHQAHGRIDRLNTPFTDLYYYILKSNSMIDRAIWKSLMSKQNFNESSFIRNVVEKGGY